MIEKARLDHEQLCAVLRDTLAGEEATVRAWIREALLDILQKDPAALGGLLRESLSGSALLQPSPEVGAALEALVKRFVYAAIAASPVAAHGAAPAKDLALFQEPSRDPPLPPAAHAGRASGIVRIPPELLAEPLEAYVARDPYPLPVTEDREGYHANQHFDYWLSGLDDWLRLLAVLRRHKVKLQKHAAVLDFGCASGRFLRHALCQAEGLELWGVDLNERHVTWLLAHLPKSLRVLHCTALPVLPLSDDHFTLVTAYSVFTHIDEYELAWLVELRRILRPGGIAYLTVHTEDTWHKLRPTVTAYDHLWQARDSIREYQITPELFQQPMPRDKTVFRWTSATLNNTNVFLSKRHLHDVWGRFFELLEIVPEGYGYQDVVVLRKPRSGLLRRD